MEDYLPHKTKARARKGILMFYWEQSFSIICRHDW